MCASPQSSFPVRVIPCGARRTVGLLALVAAQVMTMPTVLPAGNAVAAPQATGESGSPAASAQTRNRVPIDVDAWLARLKARQMQAQPDGKGLFARTSWQPPPGPQARTPPPAPPQMPAFPYRVVGLISVGGKVLLALEQKGNAHAVRVGDIIESFRIERIGEDSFVVFHASTGKTREYRYDELAAAAPSVAPLSGVLAPQSIVAPSLQGLQGAAQPAPPTAEAARAAGAAGNAMVPMGGVTTPLQPSGPAAAPLAPLGGMITVPSVRETPPPWSRSYPSVAPPQR